MSVKIAGLWELNWTTPLVESWMWTFPLREFEVSQWAMYPVTGIYQNKLAPNPSGLTEFHNMAEMVKDFPDDHTRVFVDEKGETPLNEFVHPEKACYILGCAGNNALFLKEPEDKSVFIPTKNPSGVLWPHQCLLTVLYDRRIKELQNEV